MASTPMIRESNSGAQSGIWDQIVPNNSDGHINSNSICDNPAIQKNLNELACIIFANQVNSRPEFRCSILDLDQTEGHTCVHCNRSVSSDCVEIYFDIVPSSDIYSVRGYKIGCSDCMEIHPWNELFVNAHPYTTRQELYEDNN